MLKCTCYNGFLKYDKLSLGTVWPYERLSFSHMITDQIMLTLQIENNDTQ
jgi:hypothetical protein